MRTHGMWLGTFLFAVGCGGTSTSFDGAVVPLKDQGGTETFDLSEAADDLAAPLSSKLGSIFLSADTFAGGAADTFVSASFNDFTSTSAADAGADPCTTTTVGACSVTLCTSTTSSGPAPVNLSAGKLTVTGTTVVTILPPADNTYYFSDSTTAAWSPGQTIQFAAAGATVPAFSGSLAAAAVAKVSAPALPGNGAALSIPRGTALPFTWTGGGTNSFIIGLGDATYTNSLACLFDASTGTGTIPTAALQLLPAGTSYTLSASTSPDSLTVAAGDWSILVSTSTSAQTTAGASFYVGATLQ